MKPGIISEGMDDHNHAQDAVIEAQSRHGGIRKKVSRLSLVTPKA
nr:hypothetical protein [Desulfoferrobacter suflitae]